MIYFLIGFKGGVGEMVYPDLDLNTIYHTAEDEKHSETPEEVVEILTWYF